MYHGTYTRLAVCFRKPTSSVIIADAEMDFSQGCKASEIIRILELCLINACTNALWSAIEQKSLGEPNRQLGKSLFVPLFSLCLHTSKSGSSQLRGSWGCYCFEHWLA